MPTIKLLSFTKYPLETMAYGWDVMQNDVPDTLEQYISEHTDISYFDDKFKEIVRDGVGTPAEFVSTVWVLKGVSRAFQQQLTRYRLASYSIQTLRRVNPGSFADNGDYHMPPALEGDIIATDLFQRQMFDSQQTYGALIGMGVPVEDARGILPLNIHSTITMSVNLRSLANIVKQRLCFHAQAEWKEVVKQMEEEIRTKMHPIIADELFTPMCEKVGRCFVPDRTCGKFEKIICDNCGSQIPKCDGIGDGIEIWCKHCLEEKQ